VKALGREMLGCQAFLRASPTQLIEVGAISMSGSSVIVALNAVALNRLRLPPSDNRQRSPEGDNEPPRHEAC
jgi:hypothetical protein